MPAILVSGSGIHMPYRCESGKCLFACEAVFNSNLICVAQNKYVEPGPVPKDCPVMEVRATENQISDFCKRIQGLMLEDDCK